MQERLQKIIARAGLASRRAGEDLILAGRVRVNGTIITELGAKADLFADKVEVDGVRLVADAPRYLVLHKPRNVVSTLSDPEGRPTVADLLANAGGRVYPIGRLDFATSGVLLATNDGEFANALLHPRGGVPKTYVLKVHGNMGEEDVIRWATGVKLDDGITLPADVRILRHEDDKTWLEVTLREGRNQQIRRMGEATGFPVMRLARMSFAGVTSEGLRPSEWRPLSVDELLDIRKHFGVPKKVRGASMAGPIVSPGRHGAARTPRPERGASRTDKGAPRTEGRGTRAEGRGTRADRGAPRTEGRGTRAEGRGTRADRGAPRTEGRGTRPDRGAPRTEGRGTRPDRGATYPDRGATYPDRGATYPDRGATYPDRGATRPDRGATRPDRGTTRPDTRAPRTDRGPARPDARPARAERTEAPTTRANPRARREDAPAPREKSPPRKSEAPKRPRTGAPAKPRRS